MRGVLHRTIDQLADSRHAAGQTGGSSLCATAAGLPLCAVREARAPGGLREPATDGGNVLFDAEGSFDVFERAGAGDKTRCLNVGAALRRDRASSPTEKIVGA